jgi:protease I
MPEQMTVAALLADAFQEEEFFFPKVALNKAGYAIEVVSIGKAPIEIYSYFRRTGLLDVDRAIGEADPTQYAGILIAGGAKSPALLAEDERIRSFVRNLDRRGRMVASICRGSLLTVKSGIARGRRITGFNDVVAYPDLIVEPHATAAGAIWIDGQPVVADGTLVSSPHPDHVADFAREMMRVLAESSAEKAWPIRK